MKKVAALLCILMAFTMIGCVPNQKTSSQFSSSATTVKTPQKRIKNILHDVVYLEDNMTGEKEYYSSYAFKKTEYNGRKVIVSKDNHNGMHTIAPFALTLYQDGDNLEYRLTLKYHDDSWIFFDKWLVKVDDDDIDAFSLDSLTPDRDVTSGGNVSEVYRMNPSDAMLEILNKVSNADKCTMRFSGTKGSFTFDLTENDIKAIGHILAMYRDYSS